VDSGRSDTAKGRHFEASSVRFLITEAINLSFIQQPYTFAGALNQEDLHQCIALSSCP
jgi:hypothetical protein